MTPEITATDLGLPLRASDLRAAVNLLGQSALPLARGRARRGVLTLMGIGEALPALGEKALEQLVRVVRRGADDPAFAAQFESLAAQLNPPSGAGKALSELLRRMVAAAPLVTLGTAPIRYVGSGLDDGWAKDYYAVDAGVRGQVTALLLDHARMELSVFESDPAEAPVLEVATPAVRAGRFHSANPVVSLLHAEPNGDLRILVRQRVHPAGSVAPLDVEEEGAKRAAPTNRPRTPRAATWNPQVIRGGEEREATANPPPPKRAKKGGPKAPKKEGE